MRFAFNSMMKSCHSNKKPYSAIATWLMTSLFQMWHGEIFYGKSYLVVVWHSSTYKIVKVIKLFFFFKCSKDYSGIFYMIIIIYFYNYFTFVWFFFKFIPYKLFLTCRIGWHITVCGLRTLRYPIVWCSQTTTLNWTALHFVRWSELWVRTDKPPIVLYQFYLLNVLGLCSHISKAQNYWRSNVFHNRLRV